MNVLRLTLTALMIAALSSCGPLADETMPGASFVRGLIPSGQSDQTATAGAQGLTRAAIEQNERPQILVALPTTGVTVPIALFEESRGKATYVTRDLVSVTLEDGLLIATRSLGADLMAADVDDIRPILQSGGGAVRVHDYLNGLNQIERHSYQCDVRVVGPETIEIFERSYRTTQVQEDCVSPDTSFTNIYWIDGAGTIWQSRQWVSPLIGYAEILKL